MNAVLAAIVSVVLAALMVLAGYAGGGLVAVAAVALAVLLVAIGWAVLLDLPDVRGSSAVILVSGWAALGVAAFYRTHARPLAVFTAVVAAAVLLAFAHELLRGQGRAKLVESVTGTLSGQVVVVLGAGWVLLPDTAADRAAVPVTAAALALARLVTAVPLPQRVLRWAQLLLGAGAGAAVAAVLARSLLAAGVGAAVAVAAVVAALDHVIADLPAARTRLGMIAGAAAPATGVGMVGYAAIRMLAG